MNEPKREQILAAIETALKTINPANGYLTAPKVVSRQTQGLFDCDGTAMPAIYIADGDETLAPKAIGAAYKRMEDEFTVIIYCHFDDPTKTSQLLNRLRFDILKALLADITFGGLATGLAAGGLIRIHGDLGQFVPKGTFTIEWPVKYREDIS